ncbi:MAG: hypothetical protein K8T25_02655 [Planctomycetia bacterium]|nr:hypothetical protein [Planctomycetia bacterium]
MIELTQFEASVLEWIASRSEDNALKAQIAKASVVRRQYTGVGCYTMFTLTEEVPIITAPFGARGPIGGPYFESPVVKYGGGTLLWFVDGRMHQLETYAHGDYFPEEHAELGSYTFPNIEIYGSDNRCDGSNS